jgi:hypothetical protein
VCFHLLDATSTLLGLANGWEEKNPIMSELYGFHPAALGVTKVVLGVLCCVWLWQNRAKMSTQRILDVSLAFYVVLLAYHAAGWWLWFGAQAQ